MLTVMLGVTVRTVKLTNKNPNAFQFTGTEAVATLSLGSNGDIASSGEGPFPDEWVSPQAAGVGSSYWARLTHNSGTAPSGAALGSWLSIGSGLAWSVSRGSVGETVSGCTLQIASDAAGANVLASATVSFSASVANP